jgi:hypothetical protein
MATDMDIWNKETHHCFDCGGIVEFKTQRDVDLFTYSGLCSECRDKVLEEEVATRYERDYKGRIDSIINLFDHAIAVIEDIRKDVKEWISTQQ